MLAPIRALLNKQPERRERYYGLVGRRTALWHGEVPASAPGWSRRAAARMVAVREEFSWLAEDNANVLLASGDEVAWWRFAGGRANAALAHRPARDLSVRATSDNFAVRSPPQPGLDSTEAGLRGLRGSDPAAIGPPVDERALEGLKFAACLPPEIAAHVVRARMEAHGE